MCDLLLIVHGNGYNICIVFGLDFDLIGFDSNSNSMLRFIRVWRGDPFQNQMHVSFFFCQSYLQSFLNLCCPATGTYTLK